MYSDNVLGVGNNKNAIVQLAFGMWLYCPMYWGTNCVSITGSLAGIFVVACTYSSGSFIKTELVASEYAAKVLSRTSLNTNVSNASISIHSRTNGDGTKTWWLRSEMHGFGSYLITTVDWVNTAIVKADSVPSGATLLLNNA